MKSTFEIFLDLDLLLKYSCEVNDYSGHSRVEQYNWQQLSPWESSMIEIVVNLKQKKSDF